MQAVYVNANGDTSPTRILIGPETDAFGIRRTPAGDIYAIWEPTQSKQSNHVLSCIAGEKRYGSAILVGVENGKQIPLEESTILAIMLDQVQIDEKNNSDHDEHNGNITCDCEHCAYWAEANAPMQPSSESEESPYEEYVDSCEESEECPDSP